jgi:hypothetical protein
MISLEEKRRLVIKLHLEGATIRQIAKEVHMSFRDIKKIIDEIDPKKRELSPETRALKLFLEGKSIMDVITKLDIPFDQAEKVEQQCLRVQKKNKLAQLFSEDEEKFALIFEICNLIREKTLTSEEIHNIIDYSRQISNLQSKFNLIINEVIAQENNNHALRIQNFRLKKLNDSLVNSNNQLEYEIREKQSAIQQLISSELQIQGIIAAEKEAIKKRYSESIRNYALYHDSDLVA